MWIVLKGTAKLAEVCRKERGHYLVVHRGPLLTIDRVASGFWQLVDHDGRSSDHDSLRDAREAATRVIAARAKEVR